MYTLNGLQSLLGGMTLSPRGGAKRSGTGARAGPEGVAGESPSAGGTGGRLVPSRPVPLRRLPPALSGLGVFFSPGFLPKRGCRSRSRSPGAPPRSGAGRERSTWFPDGAPPLRGRQTRRGLPASPRGRAPTAALPRGRSAPRAAGSGRGRCGESGGRSPHTWERLPQGPGWGSAPPASAWSRGHPGCPCGRLAAPALSRPVPRLTTLPR